MSAEKLARTAIATDGQRAIAVPNRGVHLGKPTSAAGAGRTALTPDLTAAELHRWYWLRDELAQFARKVGVSAAGSKRELADRVAAVLDGETPPAPARRPNRGTAQFEGELTTATVIPVGQRCTQHLRVFFKREIGRSFPV